MAVIKLINENTNEERIAANLAAIAIHEATIKQIHSHITASTDQLKVRHGLTGIACRQGCIAEIKQEIHELEKSIRRDR